MAVGILSPGLGTPKDSWLSGPNHYQALPANLSLNKYFLKSVLHTRKDFFKKEKKRKKSLRTSQKKMEEELKNKQQQNQLPVILALIDEFNLVVIHI